MGDQLGSDRHTGGPTVCAPEELAPTTGDDAHPMTTLVLMLSVLLLVGLGMVLLWERRTGGGFTLLPLVGATVVLAALVLVRVGQVMGQERVLRHRLRSSARRYRALASNSSDAVLIVDRDGALTHESSNLEGLLGGPPPPDGVDDPFWWVLPDDLHEVQAGLARVLAEPGARVTTEVRFRRPDGSLLWLSSRAVNLLDDPDVRGIVVNLHDVTGRKRLEEDLLGQALHDSLTGLANRALLRDRLEQAFRRIGRSRDGSALIYLDLDAFKTVNDTLGHDGGNEILCAVADRLRGVVRERDTVARLGGDDFAIVTVESARCLDEAVAIAGRAVQALSEPIGVGGRKVQMAVSIGIATTHEAASAAEVMRDADVALMLAKAQSKEPWVIHLPEMREAAVERLRLEADLGRALELDQLRLEYQPVVELAGERLVGFEALLRWDHPELGLVAPERFIPIAEDNGSIDEIGAWVLRMACCTAASWQRRHPLQRELTIAVNVSGRQLATHQIVREVMATLDASGLDPATLMLEMTETALVEDPAVTARVLAELKELGVRLAIDDFGTGYSSLGYLRQFPVDVLKIDRSFTSRITEQVHLPAIVRGLIELGRTLGLEMVAEGVERVAQQEQLAAEGCTFGQGYLFARPLRPEAAERLLETAPV